VRLFLILRRDLEGKGLAVLKRGAAVETETGNAQNGKLHREHIALFATRIVTRRRVNRGYGAVWKGGGVEARRVLRVLVEPEADRVLWLHVRVLLVLNQGERRGLHIAPYRLPTSSSTDSLYQANATNGWWRKRLARACKLSIHTRHFRAPRLP